MSNCLITGKETKDKIKNVPVSREGRELLKQITESHNEKIFEVYKKKNNEANNGIDLDEKTLRNFAPKLSTKRIISLLLEDEKDIIETRDEILGA